MMRKLALMAVPTIGAMMLAGCGSSSSPSANSSSNSSNHAMVLSLDQGSPGYTDNFNPFSPNMRVGTTWIYETLYAVNAQNGDQTPWLATSYKWTSSTQLVFTIRKGIKWNNGTPFTPQDVAFTFNLMHKYPAIDDNGLWSNTLKSVTVSGDNVVFDFLEPDVPAFQFIAKTPIVPESIWSKVNPATFANIHPVGTGAYDLSSFSDMTYTLKKNPSYWQANKVQVKTLEFPAIPINAATIDEQLVAGDFDIANDFMPNIKKLYVDKDPSTNHIWFAYGNPVNLVMDLSKYPFNNVAFRQALAYGINRNVVSAKGEYGEEPAASMTGLALPSQSAYLDKSLSAKYPYNHDPAKAKQLLKSIGLKKNAQGQLVGPHGPISFSITVPNAFSDWISDAEIIKTELGNLGIDVKLNTPSVSTWTSDLDLGTFDMSLTYGSSYSSPYFYYFYTLDSVNAAPIGTVTTSNFERYRNPAVDQLLTSYKGLTSESQQKAIIDQLQNVMLTQVPVIPMFYNANWNQYSTKYFTGYPTASNPYATPDYTWPDVQVEFTHLKVK